MPLSIIQSGSDLQLLDTSGGLQTLTLPAGVTLRTDVKPRWAVYQNYLVLVNTPSQPLTIDAAGIVRLLSPKAPRIAPVLTGPNAGSLTGTYRAKMTFVIQDEIGNIIAESDFGPISSAVAVAAKKLLASNLDISPDAVTGRRLYRTTDNGTPYFEWVDLDGNILTSVQDDLSDAGLALTSAPTLGTPPRLTTIAEFRGRLFGVGDIDIDSLRFTEAGFMYAWPTDNSIVIPATGGDRFGVVALIPRREALGVARRNMLVQITGTGNENQDGTIDLDTVVLSRELGVESQETVQVFRDTAFFLWKDGVYAWNDSGIRCISDGDENGKGSVRSWFTTDTYFNRDLYTSAFSHMVPDRPCYRLFLASAGSNSVDTWVEYDIESGVWWGPHETALFSPKSAFSRYDTSDRDIPVVGGTTDVYNDQTTRSDGAAAVAITFDVIGKRHDLDEPDLDKYFGEISLMGKAQTTGALSVISTVGDLNATRSITQYYDMRKNRQRLGRLGNGKHAQIRLLSAVAGVDVEIYGYEIIPVNRIGRR